MSMANPAIELVGADEGITHSFAPADVVLQAAALTDNPDVWIVETMAASCPARTRFVRHNGVYYAHDPRM